MVGLPEPFLGDLRGGRIGGGLLYVEGYFLTHGTKSALEVAKKAPEAGRSLFLTSPRRSTFIPQFFAVQLQQMLPYVDFVIGNEAEAEAWASANGLVDKTDLAAVGRAVVETPNVYPVHALSDSEIADTNGGGDVLANMHPGMRISQPPRPPVILMGHLLGRWRANGLDADLEIASRVKVHKEFLSASMRSAMETGGKARTLGDYVSRVKMQQVASSCLKTHEELKTRFEEVQEAMARLSRGGDEVRHAVGNNSTSMNFSSIDDGEGCARRAQELWEKLSAVNSAVERVVPEKALQEFRQLDDALRIEVERVTDVKNAYTEQCIYTIRRISELNTDLVTIPSAMTSLQTNRRCEGTFVGRGLSRGNLSGLSPAKIHFRRQNGDTIPPWLPIVLIVPPHPPMAPPVVAYVAAAVASAAALYAFTKFVYEPVIAPKLEAWAENFLEKRKQKKIQQGRNRQNPVLAQPTNARTGETSSARSSSDSANAMSIELERLAQRERNEWGQSAGSSGLRHRRPTAVPEESDAHIPYPVMSPTHVIFDTSLPSSPGGQSIRTSVLPSLDNSPAYPSMSLSEPSEPQQAASKSLTPSPQVMSLNVRPLVRQLPVASCHPSPHDAARALPPIHEAAAR
ncbi:hypothetical protein GSI_12008 [Ganoderma sinense ZZ0214-1]|uniref:adenosine kinase n=1 Tax=Ganoderma sinense ZZ0214-1 TaxID=1077348 RepID=A0A2G8RXL7_9APHY|nr:hypothetical protein GSI_12008 [Ganoderma sinense ZZ0214-1]